MEPTGTTSRHTIGLIGLGRMGIPVAEKLLGEGYAVAGCRRGRSDELAAMGGWVAGAGSPREVAERCDVVLTCLPSESALEEVISGPSGVVEAGHRGVVVELSTLSAERKAGQLAALEAVGNTMLDSPISGTPAMLRHGRASVFTSGDQAAYQRTEKVLRSFAGKVSYVGAFGSASRFKYLANILIAVHTAAAGEVVALAKCAGLDAGAVAEVLSDSPAATSGMFTVRASMMAKEEFPRPALGPVDMLRKDLGYVWEFVRETGAATPLLEAATALYDDADARGQGEQDIAWVVEVLLGRAGKRAGG